jgi:putative ABC transport system permease protein
MTLFSVVKKNVIGNFKSYLIYFVSMILSVVIYYTFVSLKYSKDIQNAYLRMRLTLFLQRDRSF